MTPSIRSSSRAGAEMGELRHEYHDELDRLRDGIVRLGAMTSETIGKGTAILLDRDISGAQRIIDGDDEIDAASLALEEDTTRLLALQAPMAGDLRFLLTTLRVIGELERSADLMVNVCKASRRIYDLELAPQLRGLIEAMGVEATFLIRASIDAYMDADESLGAALDDVDDRLDDLHVSYIEAIFSSHQSDNLQLQAAVQLAMIGRYYERIGDHAVNIGERVRYMVSGWLPEQSGAAVLTMREASEVASAQALLAPDAKLLGAVGPPEAPEEQSQTDIGGNGSSPDPNSGPDTDGP